jgi:2'-5' RNA ligase
VTWAESVVFEAGWRRYRRRVGRGRNDVDFGVKVADGRLDRYLTLVVRVPAEVGERVADVAATIAARQPGHYVYPATDLHLTVVDCSAVLGPGGLSDALSQLAESVAAVLARTTTTRVHLRGLNLFAASVYAQAWDPDSGLRRMRKELRARFASPTPLRDRVSFVNALRFCGPASPGLVNGVTEARGTDFGWFDVDRVELVLTDRTLSATATTRLSSYSLCSDV